jgi:hypothetical protein
MPQILRNPVLIATEQSLKKWRSPLIDLPHKKERIAQG